MRVKIPANLSDTADFVGKEDDLGLLIFASD